ncbi:hypothetical protein ACFTQL_25625 [Peribacillus butanolivorans]|uniref:hypothetical protein n=1 Tax=Peribacillus butanolivorans TaxID=421767 RepID=UPI003624BC58
MLKGTKKSAKKQPTIAFRADMEALPIQEEADIEFPSKHPGVMHQLFIIKFKKIFSENS